MVTHYALGLSLYIYHDTYVCMYMYVCVPHYHIIMATFYNYLLHIMVHMYVRMYVYMSMCLRVRVHLEFMLEALMLLF